MSILWLNRPRKFIISHTRAKPSTILRVGMLRIATSLSTATSMDTHRWQGRSMALSTIRAPMTLMEKWSWGREEARSMADSELATTQSTRPVLPLSPRFEHGARVPARRYAHGRTLHGSRWLHSRLFLFYSLFIDFYIFLHCIITLGWNIVGSARTRNEAPGGARGEDGGRAAEGGGRATEDGGRVAADVWIYEGCLRSNRSTSATDASPSSSTCSKYCFRHCESLYNIIITVSSLCRINLFSFVMCVCL